jgi:hypothetical protein
MTDIKRIDYVIVALGVIASFAGAFEQHPAEGVYLHAGFLLAGLLPYFIYAMAVALWRHALVTVHGLVLLVVHGWMIWSVRFAPTPEYEPTLLVYGPLVLALLMIPLLALALRQPWGLQQAN